MAKVLATVLLLAAFAGPTAAQKAPAVETPADAAIRLKGLDGRTYDTAEMRGQVVVASFGATWCVPCVWELKALEELIEEYAGKPVKFLWVSIDDKGRYPDSYLKDYAKMYRLTMPVLRDADGAAFAQFSATRRIPLAVFFDQVGRYVAPTHRGMTQDTIRYKEVMRKRIDSLLAAGEEKKEAGGTR